MDGQTVAAALDEATADARARLAEACAGTSPRSSRRPDTASDDEHDPEGTTAFERAQVQALIDATVEQLHDLDDARGRLDAGRYGGCEGCGAPIDPDRLAARPMARTCIACARRAGRPARTAF